MQRPFRRAPQLPRGHRFPHGPYLVLTRGSLFFAALPILALAAAAPALADYLGPDRVTTVFVEVRDPDNDVWTLTHVDPFDGFADVCLIVHTCDEHPSVERQLALCGWVADNSGCTMAFKTEEQTVVLPEATISGQLLNCNLLDGWCTTDPTLHLVGSEPLLGETIDLIEGTRNGDLFVCQGTICDVPLLQGQNDFTFWAHSSYGDTSQMGTFSAKVDSLGPVVDVPDRWYIWEPLSIQADDAGVGVGQVTLTIDGGPYGQRKYSWGNLSLVPDDFIWDRRFGDVIAPIGEYPVTVVASDLLGNSTSVAGEIVIPDPGTSGMGAAVPQQSTAAEGTVGEPSGAALSLDALLARLPEGELPGPEQRSVAVGVADAESSLVPGPSASSRSAPAAASGEALAAEPLTPSKASETASTTAGKSGLLWGAAALAAACGRSGRPPRRGLRPSGPG